MLYKASKEKLNKGLGHAFFPKGIISLWYADDTIMFVDGDPSLAANLKWVLTCFENVINYDKSEMISLNLDDKFLALLTYLVAL